MTWQMVKPCESMKYLEPVRKVIDVVPTGASIKHPFDNLRQAFLLPSCAECDEHSMIPASPPTVGVRDAKDPGLMLRVTQV